MLDAGRPGDPLPFQPQWVIASMADRGRRRRGRAGDAPAAGRRQLDPLPRWCDLGLTLDVFPGKTPEETKTRLDEVAKSKATGRVYDHAFVRHWDAWADGRRSHLFVLPASGEGMAVDVMGKMDADTPSKPFGGPEEFRSRPTDGRSSSPPRTRGPRNRGPRTSTSSWPRSTVQSRRNASPRPTQPGIPIPRSRPTARPWPIWP